MASPEKHMGGVLGKLFNIGGMGSVILMGKKSRYEFKNIVLLSNYHPDRPWALVISQLLTVWQTDKIKSPCGFGSMLRHFNLTSSKTKDRQKQNHAPRNDRQAHGRYSPICLLALLPFRLEMLEQASPSAKPRRNARLHTCQPPRTHVMSTRSLCSQPEGVTSACVPPVQQRDQQADNRR